MSKRNDWVDWVSFVNNLLLQFEVAQTFTMGDIVPYKSIIKNIVTSAKKGKNPILCSRWGVKLV